MSKVLGLDPGLSAAGLCILDPVARRCLRAWTVRTNPASPFEKRMRILSDEIRVALEGVDLLAIEDQHNVFHAKLRAGLSNPAAGRLEQVVGMARGLADARGIPVVLVTPQRIRALLGLPGGAKKDRVAAVVRMQTRNICGGISQHARDAVAIAVAGAREHHGRSVTSARLAMGGVPVHLTPEDA